MSKRKKEFGRNSFTIHRVIASWWMRWSAQERALGIRSECLSNLYRLAFFKWMGRRSLCKPPFQWVEYRSLKKKKCRKSCRFSKWLAGEIINRFWPCKFDIVVICYWAILISSMTPYIASVKLPSHTSFYQSCGSIIAEITTIILWDAWKWDREKPQSYEWKPSIFCGALMLLRV